MFPNKTNINFSVPPLIFVYSSIVEPNILGHVSIPLLKIVPIASEDQEKSRFIEFDNVEYFPLASNTFQTLKFELRDHEGDQIETDKGTIVFNLSFAQNK